MLMCTAHLNVGQIYGNQVKVRGNKPQTLIHRDICYISSEMTKKKIVTLCHSVKLK